MKIDFSKLDGLIPAVIQDSKTLEILMVGFMNEESLARLQRGHCRMVEKDRHRSWMSQSLKIQVFRRSPQG